MCVFIKYYIPLESRTNVLRWQCLDRILPISQLTSPTDNYRSQEEYTIHTKQSQDFKRQTVESDWRGRSLDRILPKLYLVSAVQDIFSSSELVEIVFQQLSERFYIPRLYGVSHFGQSVFTSFDEKQTPQNSCLSVGDVGWFMGAFDKTPFSPRSLIHCVILINVFDLFLTFNWRNMLHIQ